MNIAPFAGSEMSGTNGQGDIAGRPHGGANQEVGNEVLRIAYQSISAMMQDMERIQRAQQETIEMLRQDQGNQTVNQLTSLLDDHTLVITNNLHSTTTIWTGQ